MLKSFTIDEIRQLNKTDSAPYYAYHQNLRSDHLLVYFGSYEGNYAGMTNVKSLGCNGLFLRCDRAKWYVQKYGEFKGPEQFSRYLYDCISKKRHIKTITLAGYSMGAYGALLFSTWFPCNKIVATAPQTRFPNYLINKETPIREPEFDECLFDISRAWDVFGKPKAKIIIQSCDKVSENETFRDCEEARYIKDNHHDIDLILHPCSGHNGITPILLNMKETYERMFLA